MFYFLFFVQFIAFPDRSDAILTKYSNENPNQLSLSSSGNLGLFYNGKCQITHPNETLRINQKLDWCSNLGSHSDSPWISYHIKNKAFQLTGYSIRNGCCWYTCCCIDDNKFIDYGCCCCLYSFSLQGSNDNATWKTIHKVEKDPNFWACKFNTYELETKTEPFAYLRIILDDIISGYQYCMQINQVEFYGSVVDSYGHESFEDLNEDGDESVSIIGKIKKSDE